MQRKYDRMPDNINDIKSEATLQKWIPIVKECCNSGQSKKAWCEERGIDVKSYYYYQKKVYNLIKEPVPEFVELAPVETAMIPIESVIEDEEITKEIVQANIVAARLIVNGITIELCNGISSDIITAIVRGVQNV